MLDVGTQVPHGALRAYVMGERGAAPSRPTADDIAAMVAHRRARRSPPARSASRPRARSPTARADGDAVPGTFADEDELLALGGVLARARPRRVRGRAARHGRRGQRRRPTRSSSCSDAARRARPATRLTFSLVQTHTEPDRWRLIARPLAASCATQGVPIYPQVASRATGILFGLQSREQPVPHPPELPRARRPAARRARWRACATPRCGRASWPSRNGEWDHPLASFVVRDVLEHASRSATRSTTNRRPTDTHGRASPNARGVPRRRSSTTSCSRATAATSCSFPLTNYFDCSLDDVHEMLDAPGDGLGLGDGGAHCGADLRRQHARPHAHALGARPHARPAHHRSSTRCGWMTSRHRRRSTACTTAARIAPGYRADLNVIDHDAPAARPAGDGVRPARRRAPAHAARPATSPPSSPARSPSATTRPPARCPGRLIRGEQPPPRRFGLVNPRNGGLAEHDVLAADELLDAGAPALAAEAALLHPAERERPATCRGSRSRSPCRPRAGGRCVRPRAVTRVQVGRQPEVAVVGLGDDLVLVVEAQHREHRTEDLVAGERRCRGRRRRTRSARRSSRRRARRRAARRR